MEIVDDPLVFINDKSEGKDICHCNFCCKTLHQRCYTNRYAKVTGTKVEDNIVDIYKYQYNWKGTVNEVNIDDKWAIGPSEGRICYKCHKINVEKNKRLSEISDKILTSTIDDYDSDELRVIFDPRNLKTLCDVLTGGCTSCYERKL